MRLFIAMLGAALVFACSAAPALSMPAYDTRSESVVRSQDAAEPVISAPAAAGIGVIVVVLVGAGALLAGAGVGFAAGQRRELRTTA